MGGGSREADLEGVLSDVGGSQEREVGNSIKCFDKSSKIGNDH